MGGGGNLRAAVFGVNDGLVSNGSLILGIAGASPDPHVVLLTGIAGILTRKARLRRRCARSISLRHSANRRHHGITRRRLPRKSAIVA